MIFKSLLLKIFFFIMGIAHLLPWNSFVSNISVFKILLSEELTLKNYIAPSISITCLGSVFIGNILNLVLFHKLAYQFKIYTRLFIIFISFIIIIVFVLVSISAMSLFIMLMFLSIFINIFEPTMANLLVDDASHIGTTYVTWFNGGMSFAGLLVSILKISLIPTKISVYFKAITFFAICECFVVSAIAIYPYIYKQKCRAIIDKNEEVTLVPQTSDVVVVNGLWSEYLQIFKLKWINIISMFLTLTLTLSIYPVLLLKVISSSPNLEWKKYFEDFCTFFCFNLGDVVGRYTVLCFRIPKTDTYGLLIYTILRFGFITLLLLCNLGGSRIQIYYLFNHDTYPIIFSFFIGASNGQLMSYIYNDAYTIADNQIRYKYLTLVVLALGFGLCVGGSVTFLY